MAGLPELPEIPRVTSLWLNPTLKKSLLNKDISTIPENQTLQFVI